MSAIDPATVRELAHLARLALREDELPAVAAEIERLRGYVAQLQAVDLEGASEASEEVPDGLRPDLVEPGLSVEAALSGAPLIEAGHVALPKVLEDSGR